MDFLELSPIQFDRHRSRLVQFIQQHGDNRITHRAIRWLRELDADLLLLQAGTAIIVALSEKQLRGLIIIADYGREESLAVVHRDYRSMNIASALIQKYLDDKDKLYGRVALDNVPSIKMCLANGMVGFKLTEGPTGKPTMWFGMGNWKKEDIE